MCSTKTFLTQTEDILIEFVVKRHYAFFYRIAINDNATFRVIIAIVNYSLCSSTYYWQNAGEIAVTIPQIILIKFRFRGSKTVQCSKVLKNQHRHQFKVSNPNSMSGGMHI
jgi:hypothetical protein